MESNNPPVNILITSNYARIECSPHDMRIIRGALHVALKTGQWSQENYTRGLKIWNELNEKDFED